MNEPSPTAYDTNNTFSLLSNYSNQRYQPRAGVRNSYEETEADDSSDVSESTKVLHESEIELALKEGFQANGLRKLELAKKPYLSNDYFVTILSDGLNFHCSKHQFTKNGLDLNSPVNETNSLKSLIEINLSHNTFTLKGFELLLQTISESLFSLQILNLSFCSLGKEFAFILKNFLLSTRHLKKLLLDNNNLSNYGLQILFEAFQFNPNPSTQNTSSNLMKGSPNNPAPSGLGIASNGSPIMIETIGPTINLSNHPGNFKFLPLSQDNAIFTLEYLDLSANNIQDSGMLSICRSLLFYNKKLLLLKSIYSSLKVLKFNHNAITDKGIFCLSQLLNTKILPNSSLPKGSSPIRSFNTNNKLNPTTASLHLAINKYGINLQELSFHNNSAITSDGIIAILGNNHISASTGAVGINTSPTVSSLFLSLDSCCIHTTVRFLDFGKCKNSLLIFQYFIPVISKGLLGNLETINLDFNEDNALEIINASAKIYNKIYGNNLSSMKNMKSHSNHNLKNNPNNNQEDSIVLSYCFQLLVDALLGINHKNKVSLKSIFLGSLPKVIYDQCVVAFTSLQELANNTKAASGLGKADLLLIQNKYEDCFKALEFMNPASEIFHIPYISNIRAWVQGKQYLNLLYMTRPMISMLPQQQQQQQQQQGSQSHSQKPSKEKESPARRLSGSKQQDLATPPSKTENKEKRSSLPGSAGKLHDKTSSPFRGVARGAVGNNNNKASDSDNNSKSDREKSSKDKPEKREDRDLPTLQIVESPRVSKKTNFSSTEEEEQEEKQRRRAFSPSPLSPKRSQSSSRPSSPTKQRRDMSPIASKNNSRPASPKKDRRKEAETANDDQANVRSSSRSQSYDFSASSNKQRASQKVIPEINEKEIQDLPSDQLKQLHQDHNVAIHTLSKEIQKLIQVSTPATIHVLQNHHHQQQQQQQQQQVNNGNQSFFSTQDYSLDENASNVITVIDPLDIERANISQMFHIPPNAGSNASIATSITGGGLPDLNDPFNQSFFYQQSLLSHDIQYELMNLTESITKITEKSEGFVGYKSVAPTAEPVKKDSVADTSSKTRPVQSPSPTERPSSPNRSSSSQRPSSPTRFNTKNNQEFIESILQQHLEQLTLSYRKEIESIHASIINVANHYTKLENHFNANYEKKVLFKFTELENRLMKLEECLFYKNNQYIGGQNSYSTGGSAPAAPLPPATSSSQLLNGMISMINSNDHHHHQSSSGSVENIRGTMNERLVHQLSKTVARHQEVQEHLRPSSAPTIPSFALTFIQETNHQNNPTSSNTTTATKSIMVDELTNRLELIEKILELQKERDNNQSAAQSAAPISAVPAVSSSTPPKEDTKKDKLLQQLTHLDQMIAREKYDQDLNNINQQNILLLNASQSVETSPLSSNVPTPHFLSGNGMNQFLQPIENNINNGMNPLNTSGIATMAWGAPPSSAIPPSAASASQYHGDLFFTNSLSNINRFERIAALHSTFNQPPSSIPIPSIVDNNSIEELTNPTELRSHSSSHGKNKNKNSIGMQQPKLESTIPEYQYDTLLPTDFQPLGSTRSKSNNPGGDDQKRRKENNNHNNNDRRDLSPNKHFHRVNQSNPRSSMDTAHQQGGGLGGKDLNISPIPVHSSSNRSNSRGFMMPTRAAELKKNPFPVKLQR